MSSAPKPASRAGSLGTPLRHSGPAIHLIAFLMVLLPLADVTSGLAPFQFGEPKWRFASAGLAAGFLLTPLLGIALSLLTAALLEQRGLLRLIAWLSLPVALVLVGAAGLVALDTIQVRAGMEPALAGALALSGARTVLKLVLGAVALLAVFVTGRRAAAAIAPTRAAEPIAPFIGKPAIHSS